MKAFACLLALCALALGARAALPPDADLWLTLPDAVWARATPERLVPVELRLQRQGGQWTPMVFATAYGPFNMATHYGYVVEAKQDGASEHVRVMLRFQPDPWAGRRAEATYDLTLKADGAACAGVWTGTIHGARKEGTLSGTVESVTPTPGFTPPKAGEHPRLLVRKADVPALRAKAETPWGKAILARLQAAKGDVVAQGMAYTLTGDAQYAAAAQAMIAKGLDTSGYYHLGIAHLPAGVATEHLIAYDLVYDACDEAFHQRVRDYLADKLAFHYWGVNNTQFNPNDTSNWSLMYRSGAGLIGLTLLDAPWTLPTPVAPPPLALAPPANMPVGAGVPVVAHDPAAIIGPWLYAGPVNEARDADPFAGGMANARPEAGMKVGEATFAPIEAKFITDGSVDLTGLTGRKYFQTNYLYCVIDVKTPGAYRVETTKQEKGIRYREIWLGGRRLRTGDYVELAAGRYPLLARVWMEPLGVWEFARFWVKLSAADARVAADWQAEQQEVYEGDKAFLRAHPQRWNPESMKWLGLSTWKVESYFRKGLGDYGWNQEGEAYTRHAVRLGMPFALCWRNVFGRDVSYADHAGMILARDAAATVFAPDRARMHSYNVGGGPLGVDIYARAFGFLPDDLKPAVLWSWNRTLGLASRGKLDSAYKIVTAEDGLTLAMKFIAVDPAMAERNPGDALPKASVDWQKGGFLFRNRWQDADDCVAQLFANSNAPGGTWQSAEAGDLRLMGLGEEWTVRGQGYGNGASGRPLRDLSVNQNMVDVAEHDLLGSPQAWTTAYARAADGSGIVSLDMDGVYVTTVVQEVVTGTPPRTRTEYRGAGTRNLGIRAVRSLAVDYSGASGAPCLLAIADRLTGTQGHNTWQLTTPRDNAVTIDGNTFTITAKSGATLKGTVVTPDNAPITVEDTEQVHEINYQGGHARTKFLTRTIRVAGTDKDQTFLVVITLQRGPTPDVAVADGKATVGKQTVSFDGKQIALGTFIGKAEPIPTRPGQVDVAGPAGGDD
jgi:hypothetical protein